MGASPGSLPPRMPDIAPVVARAPVAGRSRSSALLMRRRGQLGAKATAHAPKASQGKLLLQIDMGRVCHRGIAYSPRPSFRPHSKIKTIHFFDYANTIKQGIILRLIGASVLVD